MTLKLHKEIYIQTHTTNIITMIRKIESSLQCIIVTMHYLIHNSEIDDQTIKILKIKCFVEIKMNNVSFDFMPKI